MKAEFKPGYTQKRLKLANVLPVESPFAVSIATSHLCNIKCFYCTHNWSKEQKESVGFKMQIMTRETFLKIVGQLSQFPEKIKKIEFTGLGETLLNPDTPDMVRMLLDRGITDNIDMFTNAILLDKDMTKRLTDAGLTRLRVSLQGVTNKKYEEVCGKTADFEQIVKNLKYFYENRGNTKLYIKVIDCALDEGDEQKFYDIFGDICDEIYIEHLVVAQHPLEGNQTVEDETLNMYREKTVYSDICHFAYYLLQIDAVGNVFPCPPLGLPVEFALGNVNEMTLKEMWQGEKLRNVRYEMLQTRKKELYVCGNCDKYLICAHEEDYLGNDRERLSQLYIKPKNL